MLVKQLRLIMENLDQIFYRENRECDFFSVEGQIIISILYL
jgi:hypothetical protein